MGQARAPSRPQPAPLIGGKAQGGHIGPGIFRNAPPDGRLNPPTPHQGGPVQRGSIYEHMPAGPGEFHFLYNPNSLSYTFAFNEAMADPSTTAEVRTMGPLGGTTLSMTLMINRQYEVAYGGDSHGVMNDINALKYLVGMKDDTYSYMVLKTLRFELGKNLRFYGFVNSMSAAVELFSQKMVPMAAVVQLTAFQMPVGLDPATRFTKPPAADPAAPTATPTGTTTTTTTTTTSKNAWENAAPK